MICVLLGTVSCGGGSSSTPITPSGGTPTGNYTVTVTGVSGSLTRSVNITVNVQ